MLHDVAEDEFALAAGVARIDDAGDVLALDQPREEFEAILALLDRLQVKMRRDNGQVRERPFAALHLEALGGRELEQVTDCGRQDVLRVLVVVAMAREAAERARDVVRDRRFFGDDKLFAHSVSTARETGA